MGVFWGFLAPFFFFLLDLLPVLISFAIASLRRLAFYTFGVESSPFFFSYLFVFHYLSTLSDQFSIAAFSVYIYNYAIL